jgi:hypothetical protein
LELNLGGCTQSEIQGLLALLVLLHAGISLVIKEVNSGG